MQLIRDKFCKINQNKYNFCNNIAFSYQIYWLCKRVIDELQKKNLFLEINSENQFVKIIGSNVYLIQQQMLKATQLLNKFFEILVLPELSKPDRIKSQWSYLLSLLKNENIELERIEAYLNIIEKTQAKKKVEEGRETTNTNISICKPNRTSFNIQKDRDVSPIQINKDIQKIPQDDASAAMRLLACINPINKLFCTNNKMLGDDASTRAKVDDLGVRGEELTPKLIRNNFRKQPSYEKSDTKRYSSSFKNRY